MKRRRQKKNGAGSAVVGFILGSILPPLGLGSLFAGYKPGTFWAGASWGAGVTGTIWLGAAAYEALKAAPPAPKVKQLADPVVVGDRVVALVPEQQTSAGVAGNLQSLIVTSVDPTGQILTGAIADTVHAGPAFQGVIVAFPRANISARA